MSTDVIEPQSVVPADIAEENILRVKASSSASKLASAISHALYEDRKVVLRAIGAGAVNQAVKAIAIAGSFVAQRGLIIACRPGFTSVDLPDARISAVVLYVFVVD